jgi:hypothetical protein
MQWKLRLPATDPTPTQNGSSIANFELFQAHWIGLALCDPTSYPYGGCVAVSDSNDPSTAGVAFLELQIFAPGILSDCPSTKWCVNLSIDSFHNSTPFVSLKCAETAPTQPITTNGSPTGTRLQLSTGDTILVTIKDTSVGMRADVNDLTSGAMGFMVASGANGFVHTTTLTANGVCSITTTRTCTTDADCPVNEKCGCQFEPFNFHPMWSTASPTHVVSWLGLAPNVSYSAEIGHWELCGDAACTIRPDGNDDSTFCPNIRGIGGCTNPDTDQDGTSFQANWPDGTSAHPASVVISSPDDTGVGPLSVSPINPGAYTMGYGSISFKTTTSTVAPFYPFYSAAGTGSACRFNFGNDIPGVTTNDFGKAGQYGTSMNNPCYPSGPPAPPWVVPSLPLIR